MEISRKIQFVTIKKLRLTLISYALIIASYGQKTNLSFGSGMNYGVTPPAYSLNFHYTNPTIDIISELMKLFGDSCSVQGEEYQWQQVIMEKLSKKPLNIKVIRRIYDYDPPKDDHEFYDVIIMKGDKNFLEGIRFINRSKVKKIFRQFAHT